MEPRHRTAGRIARRCSAIIGLKRNLRNHSIAAASAVALWVALPVGPAHAIDLVPCDQPDYLRVSFHLGIEDPGVRRYCFANKGTHETKGRWWVDEVSAGNNDVLFFDCNGTGRRFVQRWSTANWQPSPCVRAIEIL